MEQPLALTLEIMELRAYARAKAALDAAKKEEDVPRSAAVDWVFRVVWALKQRGRREASAD